MPTCALTKLRNCQPSAGSVTPEWTKQHVLNLLQQAALVLKTTGSQWHAPIMLALVTAAALSAAKSQPAAFATCSARLTDSCASLVRTSSSCCWLPAASTCGLMLASAVLIPLLLPAAAVPSCAGVLLLLPAAAVLLQHFAASCAACCKWPGGSRMKRGSCAARGPSGRGPSPQVDSATRSGHCKGTAACQHVCRSRSEGLARCTCTVRSQQASGSGAQAYTLQVPVMASNMRWQAVPHADAWDVHCSTARRSPSIGCMMEHACRLAPPAAP
jgi:hypothetical protein